MLPEKLYARIRLLQFIFPLFIVLLVAVFQLSVGRLTHEAAFNSAHFWAEFIFYGTLGPLLAFLLLRFLSRWLEERETSEVQARVLQETRQHAAKSRGLNDDALQTLFAASVLLASLKQSLPETPPESAALLVETENALDRAIQQIRSHLQEPPPPVVEREIPIKNNGSSR